MKTITYNPETHRLVPVEPNNTALDWVDPGFGTRKEAWERILASFPQPEPVEVEPVLYAEFSEDGGWLGEASEYQDHLEEPIALYTAPPDYEEIKRQLEEYRKDAERYQFLRNVAPNMFWDSADRQIQFVKFDVTARLWRPEVFDTAIDAAIASVKGEEA